MDTVDPTVVMGTHLCPHDACDTNTEHHISNHGIQHSVVMGSPTASDGNYNSHRDPTVSDGNYNSHRDLKHHGNICLRTNGFKTVIFCLLFLVHLITDSGEIPFYTPYRIPDPGELSEDFGRVAIMESSNDICIPKAYPIPDPGELSEDFGRVAILESSTDVCIPNASTIDTQT